MDEQEAIRLCQGGDQDSFRCLMEKHQDRAFRFACRMLGNPATAEDVTQESFLAAWRGINTFKLGQPFGPWLMKIVLRCALKRLPKDGVRLTSLDEPDGVEASDRAPGPLLSAEARERASAVRKAVVRLSPRRQRIIELFYDFGYTVEEIAELLDVPAGTVKSELYRARQELEKMLKGFLGNEE